MHILQLLARIAELERSLRAERSRAGEMAQQIRQLATLNEKLQEDNAAAAQQLHHFTDWFFSTLHQN